MLDYVLAFLGLYSAVFYLLLFMSQTERVTKDPVPKRFPSVSIIIPAYNEEKTIRRAIESVLNLDYPEKKLELIVVNDGSTDRTAEISAGYKKVKVINKVNTGKANSLNVAIKHAGGELIAVLDADSYTSKGALMNMVGYFEEPDVAAVTATVKVGEMKNVIQTVQKGEYLLGAFLRKLQSLVDGISVTPGPLSVYRKSVFEQLGGFDEHTLTEDAEIALRIQESNMRIENSLNADVFTDVPKSLGSLLKQRRRWYLGYVGNLMKHKSLLSPKYGDFGMFLLPISSVLIILVVLSYAETALHSPLAVYSNLESIPLSLSYLEITPVQVLFFAAFVISAITIYYSIHNTREYGFLGNLLSLYIVSFFMLLLWGIVLAEYVLNYLRGVDPTWKGG